MHPPIALKNRLKFSKNEKLKEVIQKIQIFVTNIKITIEIAIFMAIYSCTQLLVTQHTKTYFTSHHLYINNFLW